MLKNLIDIERRTVSLANKTVVQLARRVLKEPIRPQ
jgi:hypothetical protein